MRRPAAVLPIFAVSIIALISAVGLALDGAYAAAAVRDLQSIADYSARVAADRAVSACDDAPGAICPLNQGRARGSLDAVRAAWSRVPTSLDLGEATATFVTGADGTTRVIVTIEACHDPLLLSFAVSGDRCGDGQLDLVTSGQAAVGTGH